MSREGDNLQLKTGNGGVATQFMQILCELCKSMKATRCVHMTKCRALPFQDRVH